MKNRDTDESSFTPARNLTQLIDYAVLDQTGDKVGSVDAVWEDHTGEPAYLAVTTGWLGFGKAHIVPAHAAMVCEDRQAIKLPYTAERIKNAPSFDSQYDFTTESEATLTSYYGLGTSVNAPSSSKSVLSSPKVSGQEEARVQLKAEELKVGKREVEYGGVRLRKIVRTEIVNQPVELSREEIVIERVPSTGKSVNPTEMSFKDEELYIPLRREEAVIQKTVRAGEEVKISKRKESAKETVKETLRHEEVEIEQTGGKRPTRNAKLSQILNEAPDCWALFYARSLPFSDPLSLSQCRHNMWRIAASSLGGGDGNGGPPLREPLLMDTPRLASSYYRDLSTGFGAPHGKSGPSE